MDHEFLTLRYPFSVAVTVTSLTRKTLRNWIDRELVGPFEADAQREGEDWRRFSAFDCLRLAVANHLVNFGVSVSEAWFVSMGLFAAGASSWSKLRTRTPKEIIRSLRQRSIYRWHDGSELRWAYGDPPDAAPATLTINVSLIADRVFLGLAGADAVSPPKIPS